MTFWTTFYNVALIIFIALHLAVGGAVREPLEKSYNTPLK